MDKKSTKKVEKKEVAAEAKKTVAKAEVKESPAKKKATQGSRVIDYIKKNGKITRLSAMNDVGIANLTAVVHELRTAGFNVVSNQVECINRYGEKTSYVEYTLGDSKNGKCK